MDELERSRLDLWLARQRERWLHEELEQARGWARAWKAAARELRAGYLEAFDSVEELQVELRQARRAARAWKVAAKRYREKWQALALMNRCGDDVYEVQVGGYVERWVRDDGAQGWVLDEVRGVRDDYMDPVVPDDGAESYIADRWDPGAMEEGLSARSVTVYYGRGGRRE